MKDQISCNNRIEPVILQDAFKAMVSEIENTVLLNHQPHRYHQTSVLSEINSVYHFVKYFERLYSQCTVYFEYPCDSGRVDAVIVMPHDLILIEAKSEMEIKKFHELNAQAGRFENIDELHHLNESSSQGRRYGNDTSLRKYLKKNIETFVTSKWEIENPRLTVWGVLLAETTNRENTKRWTNDDEPFFLHRQDEWKTFFSYHREADLNKTYQLKPWWHLFGYKQIGIL